MQISLYDKDFLLKLDKSKDKTIYARITALQFNESPLETIEGRVTQGSINIDGTSAVRRSCSLSIVAQDFNYNDYYWGLKTKFKLEIGVENNIDSSYPSIIWFPQGIYLITSFNTSRTTNNFTISINGKDKMCLLNGEVGGTLESSIDFGTIEEEDKNGVWTIRKIPIQEIIRNAVHTYAGEPYHNIIINDLDTYGLELLEYRYDTPMYLYRDPEVDDNVFHNIIMENNTTQVYFEEGGNPKLLSEIDSEHLDVLVDTLNGGNSIPKEVYIKKDDEYIPYIFAKVEYGQTAGYRATDLIYPGDLIANVGEAITSILDKIKNMLTEFEYFYNLEGQFVFQKKQSFVSSMWAPAGENEAGDAAVTEGLMLSSTTAYNFSGGELITAFNNNPNLLNLRNDYSIWGERIGLSGAKIPVHMRYAIDKKPVSYNTIEVEDSDLIDYNNKYGTNLKGQKSKSYSIEDSEWREIIYQMALDYYKYNFLDDFEMRIKLANGTLYPTGQTGYENYYSDIYSFWRQLYYPGLKQMIDELNNELETKKGNSETLASTIEILEASIIELNEKKQNGTLTAEEAEDLYLKREELLQRRKEYNILLAEIENKTNQLEQYKTDSNDYYEEAGSRQYWNKNVYEHPEVLNFWFDFLDAQGELEQFNVKSIGFRQKAINDTSIKSIYFRETPSMIFTDNILKEEQKLNIGYRYIQIPNNLIEQMFSISAQGKSAKDKLDELLYQHSYCIESATITTIPIYYLEPNTRIHLYDEDTGLDGDYIASKITLPLAYNGTMTITATKAAENLY